jgi:hypothetical protein
MHTEPYKTFVCVCARKTHIVLRELIVCDTLPIFYSCFTFVIWGRRALDGPLHYFLGLEIVRRADGFFLHQCKYAQDILEHVRPILSTRTPSSPLQLDRRLQMHLTIAPLLVVCSTWLSLARSCSTPCSRSASTCMRVTMLTGPRWNGFFGTSVALWTLGSWSPPRPPWTLWLIRMQIGQGVLTLGAPPRAIA